MNKKTDGGDFEEIDRLIQCEVDEALRIFRLRDFRERLRTRIAADERPAKAKSFLERVAAPAAAVALLSVFAALFLLIDHRPPAATPVHPRFFAEVLRQLPSFSRPSADIPLGPEGMAGISESAGGFRGALASAERRKVEEERERTPRTNGPRGPVLSLKEKMTILYKDKVIERGLMLLTGKSKEA